MTRTSIDRCNGSTRIVYELYLNKTRVCYEIIRTITHPVTETENREVVCRYNTFDEAFEALLDFTRKDVI